MHLKTARLDVEQTTRTTKIMKEMTINVEKRGAVAELHHHMVVPYLAEQRTGLRHVNPLEA
jgi:hypothetical protein